MGKVMAGNHSFEAGDPIRGPRGALASRTKADRARWPRVGLAGLLATAACAPTASAPEPPAGVQAIRSSLTGPSLSRPLRELVPRPGAPAGGGAKNVIPLRRPPVPWAPGARAGAPVTDPVLQSVAGAPAAALAPTLGTSFEGIGAGFVGPAGPFTVIAVPPDDNGVAGPNHYVQTVNLSFAVFAKDGTPLLGPLPNNTIWQGFGGVCETQNSGDPTVNYDRFADRWVIAQMAIDPINFAFAECVAVSTTGDPTGTYARYAFVQNALPDYPKIGVWPDAYYLTFNEFTALTENFVGPSICALDRARMLAGQPADQICFNPGPNFGSLLPADLQGTLLPPAGAPIPLVSLDPGGAGLDLWKFHVDFINEASSTFTGPTVLPVAPFVLACADGNPCVPQPGTTQTLDTVGDRVMHRLDYRNFGDHEAMAVNHSVLVGSSVGVRWYEVRNPSSTPTVFQQGTFAPDATFRWMGSAAINRAGSIAVGYSSSSSSVFPSVRFTGRLASDPLGTMQPESVMFAGTGSQVDGVERWGDYSGLSVDPADDCTFWYTNEYLVNNGSFNWHTRIGSFTVPPCTPNPLRVFAVSLSPSIFEGGNSATATVLLTAPAPAGGATVALVSDHPNVLTVPGSVVVPAGGRTATVPVTSVKTATETVVTVTATFPAGSSASGSARVLASPIVTSLALSPTTVLSGTQATGTVTLNGPAPAGGAVVALASGDTTVATVPATFTIPAGASSGSFTITTRPQRFDFTVTISASYHSTTARAALTVTHVNNILFLELDPSTIEGSTTSTGTVFIFDPAPAGGAVVRLTSSNPGLAKVPASVTVPEGEFVASFTIATMQVPKQTAVTISGTFPAGFTQSATLTLLRSPVPAAVTLNPDTIQGGQPSIGTVTLSRAAQPPGVVVALASDNPAVATVPASIQIPAGATSGNFTVTTLVQPLDAVANVSASLNGLTQTATLTVTALPGNAAFDAKLRAPRCASPSNVCDTGAHLVLGRDNMAGGEEPNQPNTLQGSCADGTDGFFHFDESIDRLKIATADGTPLAAGKVVKVEAVVWVSAPSDVLDIFFAPNANQPSWTFEASVTTNVSQELQVLSASFVLPGGPSPAIRAQWRQLGNPEPCTAGTLNDRDDLVFALVK
jgi:hypothetical protein